MTTKAGFTLVEVVVTAGLFALLLGAVTQIYLVDTRAFSLERARIDVGLGAADVLDAFRSAALQADHVVATHSFSSVFYASSATTTIFELPAVDASGAVVSGSYDYIGIYATGTSAYRVTEGASGSARASGTKLLTDALAALSIAYDSSSFPAVTSVVVNATTSEAGSRGTVETHLLEHIYLRNL